MDNRITKERLKNFFVYDLLKVVIVCLVGGLLISLMFTSCGKRPSNGQSFYLMLSNNIAVSDDFKETTNRMINNEYDEYNFSYDILEANELTCQDAGTYSASYLMTMYLSTNQCDVFLGCDDRNLEDENSQSLIYTFITNGCASEIYGGDESFIAKAKKYALLYLEVDGENVLIKHDLVKQEFQDKYGKDSRFEKDDKYSQGLKDEEERILNIYLNATKLEKVFISHPELLVKYSIDDVEKNYCINLSKLDGKEGLLISNELVCTTNNDEVKYDILLALYDGIAANSDLEFENLAYVCNIVSRYSTYLNEV